MVPICGVGAICVLGVFDLLFWSFSGTIFYAVVALCISLLIFIVFRAIKMYGWPPRVPISADFASSNGESPLREIFPIGLYKLDATIETLNGLVELSPSEYVALNRSHDTGKVFKAPPATFCGFQWDINLGVVEGRIYKISALMLSDDTKAALKAYAAVNDFCFRHLGNYSELTMKFVTWDLPKGNVLLERPTQVPAGLWPGDSGCYVNLFLTSSLVLKAIRHPDQTA